MSHNVVVVIGMGGMGQAVARRVDPGAHLVLPDVNAVTEKLRGEGFKATPLVVDVSGDRLVSAVVCAAWERGA